MPQIMALLTSIGTIMFGILFFISVMISGLNFLFNYIIENFATLLLYFLIFMGINILICLFIILILKSFEIKKHIEFSIFIFVLSYVLIILYFKSYLNNIYLQESKKVSYTTNYTHTKEKLNYDLRDINWEYHIDTIINKSPHLKQFVKYDEYGTASIIFRDTIFKKDFIVKYIFNSSNYIISIIYNLIQSNTSNSRDIKNLINDVFDEKYNMYRKGCLSEYSNTGSITTCTLKRTKIIMQEERKNRHDGLNGELSITYLSLTKNNSQKNKNSIFEVFEP